MAQGQEAWDDSSGGLEGLLEGDSRDHKCVKLAGESFVPG